ncbi:MAG TPA: MFS transporter [Stellaceae bacterium]|jgi:putative MFS transporter|nr:MFS transporter [Stellaceae bacterium]
MLELLERQQRLTGNQKKIVAAAVIGDMLDYFDFGLIGYALAFIVGPWHLTYGQSAMILLTSGIGGIPGALFYGWLADRIGRRTVFIVTALNFSLATGIMALTPDNGGWIFLSVCRFFVGFGVAGLFTVDLPLVQEFVPTSKRGFVGGLVTSLLPIGAIMGASLGAFATPLIGWRGLFAVGLLPAAITLLIRAWVPESPRWLMRMGRTEEARHSLAWALEIDPAAIQLPTELPEAQPAAWRDLFRFPRSVALSCLTNLGVQSGSIGIGLWSTTLLVLLLKIGPAEASYLMIFASIAGLAGRFVFSYLSDAIGRKPSGVLLGFGAAASLAAAGHWHDSYIGSLSVFYLMLFGQRFFGDGGYAVVGPYSAEVWPSSLRASGMGFGFGIGNFGKIIGPLGLALIVGSSDVIAPKATIAAIEPAMLYLAAWYAMAGVVYLILGIETRGRTLEELDEALLRSQTARV